MTIVLRLAELKVPLQKWKKKKVKGKNKVEFSILYLKQLISSRNKFNSARIFSLAQKIVSIKYFCIKKLVRFY